MAGICWNPRSVVAENAICRTCPHLTSPPEGANEKQRRQKEIQTRLLLPLTLPSVSLAWKPPEAQGTVMRLLSNSRSPVTLVQIGFSDRLVIALAFIRCPPAINHLHWSTIFAGSRRRFHLMRLPRKFSLPPCGSSADMRNGPLGLAFNLHAFVGH